MKNTKKLFAILLSAAMLLSLLTACGETQKKPAGNLMEESTVCGMLVLSVESAVTITYDTDGMVTDVANAENYTDFLGKSCSTVVKELLERNKPGPDVKNIVLKVAVGSQLPTQFFLESLTTDLEKAAKLVDTSAKITVIGLDGLDADGYINAEIAETLLRNQLGTVDSVVTDGTPHNDAYTFTVTADGQPSVYNVDAVTGLISIDNTFEEELNQNEDPMETDPAPTEVIEDIPFEEEIETTPEEIPSPEV